MAKTKLKTHSGASKRLHRTGGGKLIRRKAGRRHLLTSKHSARKRRLTRTAEVSPVMTLAMKRLMPYSS